MVRRARRLPIAGEICVRVGDIVSSDTVVARTDLPGKVFPVNVANELSILPEEVPDAMKVAPGQPIASGDILAATRSLFGLFTSEVRSPTTGVLESVSSVSGQALVREPPLPVVVRAYLAGTVVEVLGDEGVMIEAEGALVQGIFGLGGEANAILRTLAGDPDQTIEAIDIPDDAAGQILLGGGLLTLDALQRCSALGVAGVVTGGFAYADVHALLGVDLAVAVTGHEDFRTTLIITEGFGRIPMAGATYQLLAAHEGTTASVNGTTQIRAGVIRPEIVIPHQHSQTGAPPRALGLTVGATVRCIRAPHFGRIGEVTALPAELAMLPSETLVRVVEVRFGDGGVVATLPRANVEVIEAA